LGNSGGGKTSLLNILGTIDKQTKVNNWFYRSG
jgi:ABC-type lipoprotein export system ATPase subunit